MYALALLLAAGIDQAQAVPAQFTHQGRLFDADDLPMEGDTELSFRLFDADVGGATVWEETQVVSLVGGFYAVILGADEFGSPLDSEVLDQAPVWLELQITGAAPMFPRTPVTSVPYATLAGIAEEVSGGPVDAAEVSVAGTLVIDGDGQWVGPTPAISWMDIGDIPSGFADGTDDDTPPASDSFLDLGISCLDGDVPVWDELGMAWTCGLDQVLDAEEVRGYVDGAYLDLGAGSTIDGRTPRFADERVDWSEIDGVPGGLADGDDDTLSATACAGGEVLVYSLAEGGWICGADGDTTLSASEVQAMVEAMTGLALDGATTIGGSSPRLDIDSIPWADLSGVPATATTDEDSLAALSCEDNDLVFWEDGAWVCGSMGDRFDVDGDGIMVWADCDDSDPDDYAIAADGDCDGVPSASDCDDDDPDVYLLGSTAACAADSCKAVLLSSPGAASGTYWIGGSELACDMDTDGGGWTIIVDQDYSTDACPSPWRGDRHPLVCARHNSGRSAVTFSSYGISWTEVRGLGGVMAYYSLDAWSTAPSSDVTGLYVDGVGFGAGTTHLYTLAQGHVSSHCSASKPSFVGSHHVCALNPGAASWSGPYSKDWWTRTLSSTSTQDITVSLMGDQAFSDEEIGVDSVKLMIR